MLNELNPERNKPIACHKLFPVPTAVGLVFNDKNQLKMGIIRDKCH